MVVGDSSRGPSSLMWNAQQRLHLALYGSVSPPSSYSSSSNRLKSLSLRCRVTSWSTREGARATQYRSARSAIRTRTAAFTLFRKYLALDVPSLPLRLRRFHAQAALGLGVSAVVDSASVLKKGTSSNSFSTTSYSISIPFSVKVALREGCLFVAAALNASEFVFPPA